MTYAEYFADFKGRFMGVDVSDIKEHLAFQFNIADEEAGGSFYVEVKDGKLIVEPYEYYDKDASFTCAPDVLDKIADGELDPVAAFTEQKLRVDGNIEKALRFKEIVDMKKDLDAKEKTLIKKTADKVKGKVVEKVAKKIVEKENKKNSL